MQTKIFVSKNIRFIFPPNMPSGSFTGMDGNELNYRNGPECTLICGLGQ